VQSVATKTKTSKRLRAKRKVLQQSRLEPGASGSFKNALQRGGGFGKKVF
jgi:hypothetical protein